MKKIIIWKSIQNQKNQTLPEPRKNLKKKKLTKQVGPKITLSQGGKAQSPLENWSATSCFHEAKQKQWPTLKQTSHYSNQRGSKGKRKANQKLSVC
jgi:hypothetical protein